MAGRDPKKIIHWLLAPTLFFGIGLYPVLIAESADAACVSSAQAATIAAAATPTPEGETPTVTVLETCGGDDISYQVPITTTITYDGVQYENVYATTNSVITFGRPDGTYWDYPTTPSISVASIDWVVYPTVRNDEHLIISSSDGGFQVDLSARPIWNQTTSVEPTNIVVTAAINSDGTVAISYLLSGPDWSQYNPRTGARLNDGTVVPLEEANIEQVEEAPVLTPEPVTPSPSPSSEPSPEPSPTPTVEPTVVPSPTATPEPSSPATPEPTPTPSPTPSPESSPTPSPSPTVEPSPSPTNEPSPNASPEPTSSPSPSVEPSPTASPEVSPTSNPIPTPEPSPQPQPQPNPTPEPPAPQPPIVRPEPIVIPPVIIPEPTPDEPVVEEPVEEIPEEEVPIVEEPIEEPVEEVEEPIEEPVEETPIDEPVEEPIEEPIEETPTEEVEEPVEESVAEEIIEEEVITEEPEVVEAEVEGLVPNNPDSLPEDEPLLPPQELLVPRIQVDKAGVENGGIQFFGTKSQPQVIGEDGQLTPPPPPPGSGLPIPPEAITTTETFIGQAGGVTFNSPDIAVPVEMTYVCTTIVTEEGKEVHLDIDGNEHPIEECTFLPAALDAIPGADVAIQAIGAAYVAMANLGNDMSPITRKKAKKILIATIIASTLWRRFGD